MDSIPLPTLLSALAALLVSPLFFYFRRCRSQVKIATATTEELWISKLMIYPIKSVRGLQVPRATLLETGLKGDRLYAFALRELQEDHSEGFNLWTMYESQDLGRFVAKFDPEDDNSFTVEALFTADPTAPKSIKLSFTPNTSELGEPIPFRIGISNPTTVYDMGDLASEFFTRHLPPTSIPEGSRIRLIHKGPMRRTLTGCGQDLRGSINLQNVLPLLLCNQASWDDTADKMRAAPNGEPHETVGTIDRMRGNIIISGTTPWAEDHWKRARIHTSAPGSQYCDLDVVGRCMRCVIVTVNPETGEKSVIGEPLKTMSSFRRIDEGAKYKVAFGMHAVPDMTDLEREQGIVLTVGDKFEVERTGSHFYINGYAGDHPDEKRPLRLVQAASSTKEEPALSLVKPDVSRKISVEEFGKHNSEESCWFVVKGEVYDVTSYLKDHPGGVDAITLVAAMDATSDFLAIHSLDAKKQLAQFHIGTLDGELTTSVEKDEPSPTFLHKTKWKSAKLIKISRISHDSRIYRFALQFPEQDLGLPTGQHVFCRLTRKDTGELVQRAYTPISREDEKGYLDLLVKVYHRTDVFPDGGKMTLGFEELVLGDEIEFKGPLGSFVWQGQGVAQWKGVERKVKNVGMICAGSGITPIYQVARAIANDEQDSETCMWIVNSNRNEEDILMRDDMDGLSLKAGPTKMNHHLVLSKPPVNWTSSKGRINLDILKQHLPPKSEDALVLVCGPDPLIDQVVKPGLAQLGWDVPNQLVVF